VDVEIGDPAGTRYRTLAARSHHLASALLLLAVLGVWELASRNGLVHQIILPAPSAIFAAMRDLFTSTFLLPHLWTTLYETLVGFVIASVVAFVVAVLLSNFAFARGVFYPYIVTFQVLPKVALAPIFITWLGFGLSSKIFLAATISFFPVLVNTLAGFESVSESSSALMRSLVASRWQIFYRLSLPWSLPYVFAGLKTSLTLALIGAIVAEFEGAQRGLAVLIKSFSYQFKMPQVFAVLFVLGALGLLLYGLMEYLERRIVYWNRVDSS
jgi:NitT/TauT family transport system permease protein